MSNMDPEDAGRLMIMRVKEWDVIEGMGFFDISSEHTAALDTQDGSLDEFLSRSPEMGLDHG